MLNRILGFLPCFLEAKHVIIDAVVESDGLDELRNRDRDNINRALLNY